MKTATKVYSSNRIENQNCKKKIKIMMNLLRCLRGSMSVCKASQKEFFDTYGIWCDRLAIKESRERI